MIARPTCRCGHEFRWDASAPRTIEVDCPTCDRTWLAAFRRGQIYAFLETTYSSGNSAERAVAFELGRIVADEEYPEDPAGRRAFLGEWDRSVDERLPRIAPLWWIQLITTVRRAAFHLTHREVAHGGA